MTKKELSQLFYLNREIHRQKQQLQQLECIATKTTPCIEITGIRGSGLEPDKIAKYAADIADLKGIIEANIAKCFYELNRLNRYIQAIDSSEIRMILSLRYVNGLTWKEVANSISHYATEDSVRMMHDRFLKGS